MSNSLRLHRLAYQAPLSIGPPRQEYWSGLLLPSPGDLPNPGIEPRFPTLQADSLSSEPPGKPRWNHTAYNLLILLFSLSIMPPGSIQTVVWSNSWFLLLLNSFPWYKCITDCPTIYLLRSILTVSSLGLLQIRLLWMFSLCEYQVIFYPMTTLHGHTVGPQSILLGD